MIITDPLSIKVYDWDRIGTNDLIGEVLVDLVNLQRRSNLPMGQDFAVKSSWPVSDKGGVITCNVSFQYVSFEQSQAITKTVQQKLAKKKTGFLSKFSSSKNVNSVAHDNGDLGMPSFAYYTLRTHLYSARSLTALDSNGLSDPYVVIRCCGNMCKFPVKKKTLNPQWYLSKEMHIQLPVPLELAPHIQVFFYDQDLLDKDDPIGRFSVTCLQVFQTQETNFPSLPHEICVAYNVIQAEGSSVPGVINPEWHTLMDWENAPLGDSQALMAFQLIPHEETKEYGDISSVNIEPPTMVQRLFEFQHPLFRPSAYFPSAEGSR